MDKSITKKRVFRKRNIPYYITGILLILLAIWYFSTDHRSYMKVKKAELITTTVQEGLFHDFIRVSGQIAPTKSVLITPKESGVVEYVVAEEGTYVREGDPIFVMSNSQLSLSIMESEASLAEKENFLRNTLVQMEQQKLDLAQSRLVAQLDKDRREREFLQNEALYNEKLIAREDYIRSRENLDYSQRTLALFLERQKQDSLYRYVQIANMEESLTSMRNSMHLIRERLNNLTVKSPVDGQIGLLDILTGQSVVNGTNVGIVNNISHFRIESRIDEHYIDRVSTGLTAYTERQGIKYPLTVTKVYPNVAEGKFKTDFVFTGEKPENIRSGQTLYVILELGLPNQSILIPRGNFFPFTGGTWIFVIEAGGEKAYRRNIVIGRQNPDFYEILHGLEPGEKVIVSGYEGYGNNELLILN